MMKRLLTGIALLGFVGCGGEPPTAEVGKASSALTFPTTGRIMFAPANTMLSAVLVQVPISTGRTTQVPFTSSSYAMTATTYATVQTGSTYGGSGTYDLNVTVGAMSPQPTMGSGQDIKCQISFRGIPSTAASGMNATFPTQWGSNFSGAQYGAFNWPGVINATGPASSCQPYWGGWNHPVAFAFAGFIPQQNVVPGASLYEMLLRVDIDFPEYSITNRWYFNFTKTADSP
jgi:hypothetical protein